MLKEIPLSTVLFLDIETVPLIYEYENLDPRQKELFTGKTRIYQKDQADAPELYKKAGIYAEFGKIICISTGWIESAGNRQAIRIRSFSGDNEYDLLSGFLSFLGEKNLVKKLCAHNGKEFDFPWLCRRMIIHGMELHPLLDLQGKKPWESPHLDTMELWKFGDYKNYTSLELLSAILNVPSPKDDIRGSDVARVYWEEGNLEKIVKYCQKDVIALIQVFLRFRGEALIETIEIQNTAVLQQ